MKDERSALDFDDLEALTYKLLHEYPEVAERYAHGEFRHLMVDEFQDTNVLQRDVVKMLCGLEDGRLFVVGDPKQSIYAFRGADVSVFHDERASIKDSGGHETLLRDSFRSHYRLVEAFNDLFQRILAGEDARIARYEVTLDDRMAAARDAEDFHETPITFILMDEKPPALGEKLSAEELRRWEAYEIVQQLKAMKESGALVHDGAEYRPFEFGDVAILFQAMSNAPLYEEVFKQNDLPYVTIAGKGYYDRQEVWDMLNLLRALHNTADDLALASVLRSPMFGLSDEALLALRLQRDDEDARLLLWEALQHDPSPVPEDDRAALLFARECLNRLLELAGRVTVDSLLAAALDETAYDAILTGAAGRRPPTG